MDNEQIEKLQLCYVKLLWSNRLCQKDVILTIALPHLMLHSYTHVVATKILTTIMVKVIMLLHKE